MSTYKLSKKDAISTMGSSRGSQIKFCKDGYWYKIDEAGPEGLAEALVSVVLEHSSLEGSEYVKYEKCNIEYGDKVYSGCRSAHFLGENEQFISYEKIYSLLTGNKLSEDIIPLNDPNERISFVCDIIKEFADIDVHDHISKVLTLDMFTLNTDRHFNNIGIIMDMKFENARNSPIFDNGAAFLSNYTRNPPSLDIDEIDVHSNVFGRPFSPDLEYQAICSGFGVQFDFKGIINDLSEREDMNDVFNTRQGKILLRQIEAYKNDLSLD